MPAIVHISPSLAARGLALVSQSVQEQISGLVNVSVEYVTTVANRDRVAAMFYLDAPPPIFPNCVNKLELQNRALYMVARNIKQANGLVTIDADYAGGLRRGGSPPLLITTLRDGPNGFDTEPEPTTITEVRYPNAPTDYSISSTTTLTYTPRESLSYYSIVYEYTFVDIDGLRPTLPALGKLYDVLSYRKRIFGRRFDELRQAVLVDLSSDSTKPELPGNAGQYGLPYFVEYLDRQPVITDEKPTFVTPTVKLVTIRKYIN